MKKLSLFFAICAVLATGYFIVLQVTDPAPFSFTDVWLVAGVCLMLVSFSIQQHNYHLSKLQKKISGTVLLLLCAVVAVNLFQILTPAVSSGSERTDYLIILGGGLRTDGSPGKIPQRRLQRAAEYLITHRDTKVIVTGGKGRFLPAAEAPVLAHRLEELGVTGDRILQENRALDTIQNLSFSAECMARDANLSLAEILERPVTILTSRYHLARAERIAALEGYKKVYGIAADIPMYLIPNAYGRETGATLKLELRRFFTGKPAGLDDRTPE
jgi:uncharacterized SAM-binding protein YcdF (DUF218 family)